MKIKYFLNLSIGLVCVLLSISSYALNSDTGYIIDGEADVTLSDLRVSNSNGPCISINNSVNITIQNSVIGPCKGVAIKITDQSDAIKISNNRIYDSNGGVEARHSQQIQVIRNQFANINMHYDNTSRGQYVQFNNVFGSNNKINYNWGETVLGLGSTNDLVNIFQSNGDIDSPIEIIGNMFRGGGPIYSGSGIMTGDGGGSNVIVKDNILVNPGAVGIGIAGGHHIQILNNKVFSEKNSFSNVGIYVWNQSKSRCSNHTVEGNFVNWTKKDGSKFNMWDGKNCGFINGWANNTRNAKINANMTIGNLISHELLAYLPFDSFADESENLLHVINVGNPSIPAGEFDGTNHLQLKSTPFLDIDDFTVSLWVKPSSTSGTIGLLKSQNSDGWSSGWRMTIEDGLLIARLSTVSKSQTLQCGSVSNQQWSFVTFRYDGKSVECHLNGDLIDSKPIYNQIRYKGKSGMLIAKANGTTQFSGLLDEFKFYKGKLTNSQIQEMYLRSKAFF